METRTLIESNQTAIRELAREIDMLKARLYEIQNMIISLHSSLALLEGSVYRY